MKRVVITGVGVVSPLGNDVDTMMDGLAAGKSAVRRMDEWSMYQGLHSLVGAPAVLENEKQIPRQNRRSMGRLSLFAAQAAKRAIDDAGLPEELVASDRTGCAVGSTMGSAASITETFELVLPERDISQLPSTKFFQCVSHTAAMNISQYLGISGTVFAPSAACASGLQALGAGYDLIRCGRQDRVLCGGAEELHPTVTGSFDVLFATSSHHNDSPETTPRPFDKDRDGLVCGEGAGILVLEDRELALARGAKIYAEVLGFSTCGSGAHISQSNADAMVRCLKQALRESQVQPSEIDYISAHATATVHGDVEEAKALQEIFGDAVPVSSLKGHMGHTLGASGAIELIASLAMMERNTIAPTLNLENVDPGCEGIQHVFKPLEKQVNTIIKNSFAFGGINAALVCRKI
ncbi:3-oxoacyl-[acyl-carrier-protein] synthase 1 [Pontiella desulfatans]|uniref:3-oxoacyl-[acyl-carrier-protein] synthase 1 n=1 Tax=Pontiella desulfatans TaxID=2750659 RepID=A0A6C2U3H8_PONDE|nr:beta-ketoacyl synthase N-terminal-like domain-containing protein [Pontiella desulfatans]VGO14562.1 3-oxoacyl-[acyl-carrier-protein] synthase 1 [Pontiella desulfatans]